MAEQQYPAQGPLCAGPANEPPPAYCYQPPAPGAAAGPPPENVKVVIVEEKPPKKQGLFGSFMKEVDKLGKQLGKELDHASSKINEAVDRNWSSSFLDLFKNGNVIQLVSRVTGRTVQIVTGSTGQLVVDATGPLDPGAYNSLWTVTNIGNNQVQLSNYNNYLAVVDGKTTIVNVPSGSVPGNETKFQLSQIQGQFATLECINAKNNHVGFTPNGELKTAMVTGKEIDAQFGVKLVSTAYPTVQPVKH